MAKPPVLGNDPFQRGAAPRPAITAAVPVEAGAHPPPSQPTAASSPAEARPGGRAAGEQAAQHETRAADSRRTVVSSAKQAPTRSPKRPGGPAQAEPAPATPTPAAPASRKRAAALRERARRIEEPDSTPPHPSQPASPLPSSRAQADRHASRDREQPAPVFEGEIVLDDLSPRLALPAPSRASNGAERTPSEKTMDALLGHARAAAALVTGALERVAETGIGRRASQALLESPWAQRFLVSAAGAFQVARPAFERASRLLPPALTATRSALASVVSGEAARDLVSAAAEAGEAARKMATRVEPGVLEVDSFGEDPALLSRVEPLFDFLHDRYFRIETLGHENVAAGACLLVCNHSGALPLDGPMLRTVLRRECGRPDSRWLVEDAIFHAPFMGTWLNRLGAIRACPENAERLLAQKVAVAVFPEGLLGMSKPLTRRYQLQRFGRGGFVKLAMRTGAPIVPVAIVGAEDASPLLAKIRLPGLGLPYLPLTPPPLPFKWTVSFLKPLRLERAGDRADLVVHHTAEVRQAIQHEVTRLRSLGWPAERACATT